MADKVFHSNAVTFVDMTDSRVLDVYITSNHPTVQLCNVNKTPLEYTPDWSATNLSLEASFYLDSSEIVPETIEWYTKIGTTKTTIGNNSVLRVTNNVLENNAIITYGCQITYQNLEAFREITFTRVDTGLNGTNGTSAPAVQAQYSADGSTGWTHTLNTSTHKYIRYSYDNGNTWTAAIKIVGEDGTSVRVKGTATSKSPVDGTSYYTLVYNSTQITGATIGDAYLLDGDMYICVDSRSGDDYFMYVGRIQGPQGNDGQSSYVFIRYATNASGGNMVANPSSSTTHIGICTTNTNVAPTIASSYTWSKFVGDNAKSITLNGTSQIFKVSQDATQTYAPATITVTAQTVNTTVTTWEYSVNGGVNWTTKIPDGVSLNLSTNTLTITGELLASNALVIRASNGVYNDTYTVYKVFDGTNGTPGSPGTPASMAFLTNENISVAANSSGVVNNTTTLNIITSVAAYNGSTKQMPELGELNDIPPGMNIVISDDILLQEKQLAISFENGATLGSSASNSGTITIPVISPVVTKLKLSWSKINSGAKGDKGDKGVDSYAVLLTNESHIFAGDVKNAIEGTAETQILAYKGSTSQTIRIDSVDGVSAGIIDTNTTIPGLKFICDTLSGTSPKITFKCTTDFKKANGTIPIKLTVDGVSFTKMFTYSIAFKGTTGNPGNPGSPGTPASLVNITPSAHYFKSTTGKDGAFTPDYIYLYPRFQTVTFSKWEYSINGGTTWVAASGANGLTISTYNSVANTLRIAKTSTLYTDTVTSISFRCVSSNSSVYDTVSIAKIYDVVDLQIGGRNLLLNTGFDGGVNKIYNLPSSATSGEGGLTFNLIEPLSAGTTVALRFQVRGLANLNVYWLMTGGNVAQLVKSKNNISAAEFSTVEVKYTVPTGKTLNSVFICTAYGNSTAGVDWFEIKAQSLKLELGNIFTDWSPAPEDLNNITFQIYAPNGYLLTNDLQSISLQAFAYEGSIEITSGATFQWSHLIDDVWTNISGATNATLAVTKSDVLKAKSYRCIMTYKNKSYTSTITVQDKTDAYNSIMCISSNAKGSECYWVLYTLVYSDTSEIDPLLGPISISAPTSPVNGDYWYAVDSINATVQLKEYNGTVWVNSTDKQSLTYLWNIVNDGSVKTPIGGASKVQVVSCHDFTATATLMCDVGNELDGILTQSSLSITDASDPIVSQTEPTSAVDGQIWIKPNTNGAYNMFIWSEAVQAWIASDMDTRNKVYTSIPSSYNKGDIWITESNTVHSKYLEGTLLQASQDSTTYNENDWSSTLKYDKDIEKINSTLYDLSQYVTITSSGLKIGAVNSDKELSPFTSLFTSTELAFYQNSDKLLTLANNQLTAPRIVVEEELEVNKKISLGDLQITIESNGSFSFAVTK
jgi:hypothetical protein